MKRNVGTVDRMARALGGGAMIASGFLTPLPVALFGALAGTGGYLLFTAVAGSCLGYRLMGRSTCPLEPTR